MSFWMIRTSMPGYVSAVPDLASGHTPTSMSGATALNQAVSLAFFAGAVRLAQERLVHPRRVVVLVADVDEDVLEPSLGEEAGRLLDRPANRRLVVELLVLAVREQADHDDHAPPVRLAHQRFEPPGDRRLELAVAGEAVEARGRVGPAAVAALDVDADQVDSVGGHVVEVADVPFGDRLAQQRVAAPQAPEFHLLAAQPRAIAADLELAGRRRFVGQKVLPGRHDDECPGHDSDNPRKAIQHGDSLSGAEWGERNPKDTVSALLGTHTVSVDLGGVDVMPSVVSFFLLNRRARMFSRSSNSE